MTDNLAITYTEADINLIPRRLTLPEALTNALADRDSAYDAYGEALIKYDDVIRQDYIKAAQERDAVNARAAIASGANPDDVPSEVERVTAQRGRAFGIVNGLAERVRQCDREIYRQWVAALPQTEGELSTALDAAEDAYRKAEDAYRAARGNFSALTNTLAYVSLMRRGVVRSQSDMPRFTPHRDKDLVEYGREYLGNLGVGTDASVDKQRVFDNGIPQTVYRAKPEAPAADK
ncbi:hypothetical protein [Streptomyces sp. NBC_00299]|uniref:hypothetical protein n=1 Tax=Streptomyces sp. NBC_00299 TaxID=2975705 RepID=UPI002E2C5157|nr:hypothetical protein [Streptomyces sp. NBC_00299]